MRGVDLVLLVAAAWVLLRLARLYAIAANLLRGELAAPTVAPIDEADVPAWVRDVLAPTVGRLGGPEHGLEPAGWTRSTESYPAGAQPRFAAHLCDAAQQVHAFVVPTWTPSPGQTVEASCATALDDGTWLITAPMALEARLVEVPGLRLAGDSGQPEAVLGLHRQRLSEVSAEGIAARALAPGALVEALAAVSARSWAALSDPAVTAPGSAPDRRVLRMGRALRFALRVSRARRPPSPGPPTAVPVEAPRVEHDLWAIRELERIRGARAGLRLRAGLFVLSGLAFALVLTRWLEPRIVLALSGVVLLHELGHWAAMRAFGYRDTSIFFVPFFGAAASGRKDDAPLWQEVVVLLAGPAPGLALGLLVGARPELAGPLGSQLGLLLVGLNALNLVPVLPLDGGRVVHAVLFAGRGGADVAFRSLGAAACIAASVWIADPMPALLGLVVLAGLPGALAAARVGRHVDRDAVRDETDESALLAVLVRAVHASGGSEAPFARKVGFVRLARRGLRRAPASILQRLGLLAAYAATVALGVAAARPWLPRGAGAAERFRHHRLDYACEDPSPLPSVFDFDPPSRRGHVELACVGPLLPGAEAATELLADYLALPAAARARPPWRGLPSEDQRLAWATFRWLRDRRDAIVFAGDDPDPDERRVLARAARELTGSGQPHDPAVVEACLEAADDPLSATLLERLGAPSPGARADRATLLGRIGTATLAEGRPALRLLMRDADGADLDALVRHACLRLCRRWEVTATVVTDP